jgi:hypothetical protein
MNKPLRPTGAESTSIESPFGGPAARLFTGDFSILVGKRVQRPCLAYSQRPELCNV